MGAELLLIGCESESEDTSLSSPRVEVVGLSL